MNPDPFGLLILNPSSPRPVNPSSYHKSDNPRPSNAQAPESQSNPTVNTPNTEAFPPLPSHKKTFPEPPLGNLCIKPMDKLETCYSQTPMKISSQIHPPYHPWPK
ncbi:hypothetical protein NE237_023392 [Protea cynaroides]|uniref:Uncharacterized protein n=1 Tax=Protea cynaroides TaxID=273540 RepID=A0A9Q0K6K8_9MAGN|nr:hypothetical protein NE237_023392 [Protea cynaroides]